MQNRLKYFIKYIIEKSLPFFLRKNEIRNIIANSDYFIGEKRLKPMLKLLNVAELRSRDKILELFFHSKSQFGQDLFVLAALDFPKFGYFVEFGAADGKEISNTFLLEKEFQWMGILAEPAKVWRKHLIRNRKAHIETRCVYSETGKWLEFQESKKFATLSAIKSDGDHIPSPMNYKVETISLFDLLDEFKAPQIIDYLSIDTEGSELSILRNFNFSKYSFKIITVEHNFRNDAKELIDLLKSKGYVQVFPELSGIEGWFLNEKFKYKNFQFLELDVH